MYLATISCAAKYFLRRRARRSYRGSRLGIECSETDDLSMPSQMAVIFWPKCSLDETRPLPPPPLLALLEASPLRPYGPVLVRNM